MYAYLLLHVIEDNEFAVPLRDIYYNYLHLINSLTQISMFENLNLPLLNLFSRKIPAVPHLAFVHYGILSGQIYKSKYDYRATTDNAAL